jgi:hypothetical protein
MSRWSKKFRNSRREEDRGFGSEHPPFAKGAKHGAPSSSFERNSNFEKGIYAFLNRIASLKRTFRDGGEVDSGKKLESTAKNPCASGIPLRWNY